MSRTLKPDMLERICPLVEQGLNGTQIAKAVGIGEREARRYAQQIRAGRTSPNGSGPDLTPRAPEPVMVPLAQIDLLGQFRGDGGTQARERLDRDAIQDYASAMEEGAVFPPVVLFRDGEQYWIGDGYHRIAAAQRVGFTAIRDEEWQQWSDREIARHCGVTHPFVAKLRQELSGNGYQMPETRQVRRGETVYEMDTSRVGAHETTTAPTIGTPEPEDDQATEPTPITEPEAHDDDDAEDDAYTLYLEAWERLSQAHAFWVRHVDGRLVDEVVTRAKADVSSHIKALDAMADSLQFYATGLQRACEQ
jgi:hypothetical protein